jgi:hypothetical protein
MNYAKREVIHAIDYLNGHTKLHRVILDKMYNGESVGGDYDASRLRFSYSISAIIHAALGDEAASILALKGVGDNCIGPIEGDIYFFASSLFKY